MIKKTFVTLTTLAALAIGAGSLSAQPAIKLVVVDMARVYDNHYKTQEANAKFRDAETKAQEQVEELSKQGQALVDEYKELIEQSKNAVLSAERRSQAEGQAQQKLEEIQRKQAEVQNFRVNTGNSLRQRIQTHRDLLLEEITKVVNELARKRGATLVVDKSGPTIFGISNILYADPGFDMTEEVLTEVNKDRPPTPPASQDSSGGAAALPTTPDSGGFTVPNVTQPANKP